MENGHHPPRRWYTTKQAAAYLEIHVRTLYKWMRRNRGKKPPYRRFGKGNYRFPIEEFKAWVDGPEK